VDDRLFQIVRRPHVSGADALLPDEVEEEEHEDRLIALHKELRPLVQGLATALRPALDLPVALFGHSLGALLAIELARELRRRRGPLPVHLFVSGRHAPQVADPLVRYPLRTLVVDIQANGAPGVASRS
jgi:surfactin synthase thioesterase subunit